MANGELTPETIEEFIAAQQALLPRMEPPVAPPSMQFVTGRIPSSVMAPPPVPLPMRVPQRFTATSAPPVIDPLEAMRKRINEIDFKTKQEAVEAATQFEAMRQYQQDLAAGKDPSRWLPLLFKKNPTVIPGMMRERRLAAPPEVFRGSNVPPAVVYGGRVAFPPSSSLPKPPLSTNVTEFFEPGTTNRIAYGFETGPQSRRVVETKRPGLTDAQLVSALPRAIAAGEKELEGIGTTLTSFEDKTIENEKARKAAAKPLFDAAQARRAELKSHIEGWREQHRAMLPGGRSAPAARPLPSPKTKEAYDALPAGSRYLDPNGVERVKK